MSHKKAKSQRRAVRAIAKHPREVKLVHEGPFHIPSFPAGIGPGCLFYPRQLVASCGRAVYRTLKKAERKGLVQGV